MMLDTHEIAALAAWRHALHRAPELSGEERQTAATVAAMLREAGADAIHEGLGGHGVAAEFRSGVPGPRVMLRCELDALPIEETSTAEHRSRVPGKAHLCGHDGHMTLLAAVALRLSKQRPPRGTVILMFQPAEETGAGARAVVSDPAFKGLAPDLVFAIHNMPGVPLGQVAIRKGPVSCASRGMHLRLKGRPSHAAEPEKALSPMRALSRLMPALADLAEGAPGEPEFALVTVTHARMGEPAFGVTPGEADLYVTLRTLTDARMERLVSGAEALARRMAADEGLTVEIGYEDVFDATTNHPAAADIVTRALEALGVRHGPEPLPMRASEDVGQFGAGAPLAFMLLGAGEDVAPVHTPTYDFPDELIPLGAALYDAIVREALSPGRDGT
ncbi:amidohydrolase [Primorskyibacter sp. 2E107]|uniref:amidohydrolase n=1 Tax=Primorskyibacter sp. 2E107 TaxID=3403458 RepID=UPI003AF8989B